MRIILLGAPGAGKGTQAEIIAKRLSIPVISTGNILREAMRNETEMGLKAKGFVESGALVPDDVIIGILRERLSESDCADGFILDGVPRTVNQADAISDMGIIIDRVVNIEIADEVIIKRMAGRRVCPDCGMSYHVENNPPKEAGVCGNCGQNLQTRKDDREETVSERLRVYHLQTEPLKDYYSHTGKLRSVEGNAPIDDITREILSALET
ncbi:MAG: adenylate kinase [Oscillospiraceae bacterium]|nr:adenylate kinase [Oscillospiraceae bacterium]